MNFQLLKSTFSIIFGKLSYWITNVFIGSTLFIFIGWDLREFFAVVRWCPLISSRLITTFTKVTSLAIDFFATHWWQNCTISLTFKSLYSVVSSKTCTLIQDYLLLPLTVIPSCKLLIFTFHYLSSTFFFPYTDHYSVFTESFIVILTFSYTILNDKLYLLDRLCTVWVKIGVFGLNFSSFIMQVFSTTLVWIAIDLFFIALVIGFSFDGLLPWGKRLYFTYFKVHM